jgi:hypothetical protein
MTARLQIEREIMKNYAEMAGSHTAANKRTTKEISNHASPANPAVRKTSPPFLIPFCLGKENQKIKFVRRTSA